MLWISRGGGGLLCSGSRRPRWSRILPIDHEGEDAHALATAGTDEPGCLQARSLRTSSCEMARLSSRLPSSRSRKQRHEPCAVPSWQRMPRAIWRSAAVGGDRVQVRMPLQEISRAGDRDDDPGPRVGRVARDTDQLLDRLGPRAGQLREQLPTAAEQRPPRPVDPASDLHAQPRAGGRGAGRRERRPFRLPGPSVSEEVVKTGPGRERWAPPGPVRGARCSGEAHDHGAVS